MDHAEKKGYDDSEMLKDGEELRLLVARARNHGSDDHYLEVLCCLRESKVIVPCDIGMSDADIQLFSNAKAGDVISPHESLHVVTGSIKSGEKSYLPVFSNPEQMGKNTGSVSAFRRITQNLLCGIEKQLSRDMLRHNIIWV